MPRDEWAKARAKDAAKRLARQNSSRKKASRARAIRRKQSAVTESRLQGPQTVMWFGKFKGLTLRQISVQDPSYITWLTGLTPVGWRLKLLVDYLRTSPKLANRRSARHTGGDEAPAITKMADGNRQTRPNPSRTAKDLPCEEIGRWENDFYPLSAETSSWCVENSLD